LADEALEPSPEKALAIAADGPTWPGHGASIRSIPS